MKNINKKIMIIILGVIFLVFILIGLSHLFLPNKKEQSILVEKDNITLKPDTIYGFKAICYPKECELSYLSNNEEIFIIDENGDITAKSLGNAILTIKSEKLEKKINITVSEEQINLNSIEIIPNELKLNINDKYLLKTILYPTNTDETIVWTNTNSAVINVNNGYIEALNDGISTITAKIEGTNIQSQIKVIVGKETVAQVEKIEINEEVITMGLNEAYQLSPIIFPSKATNFNLDYHIDNNEIATITPDGLVKSKAKGTAVITILSTNGVTKTVELKVESSQNDIALNTDNIVITKGEKYQLKSNYVSGIEWYSSNNKVAIVSSDGIVTGISNGEAIITVINKYGRIDTANIKVSGNGIAVNNITLDKNNISLKPGSTYKISATVLPTNATNKTIIYETNDSRIALVNDSGIITALREGETLITAYSQNGKQASLKVKVSLNAISIDSLEINPNNVTLKKGETFQFLATIIPSNATDKKVLWTSSNPNVATIDSNGFLSANKKGSTIITATSNGISETASVIVSDNVVELTSLEINEKNFEMEIGQTKLLTTTYSPTNATNKKFIWTSSNNDVIAVTSEGIVTALKTGTATVTVTSTNNIKRSITITVKATSTSNPNNNIAVTEIYLSLENVSLHLGQTKQLKATLVPLNATNKAVTWISSNEAVAKISDSGLITAISAGTSQIAAISANGKTAKTTVTVAYPPIYDNGEKLIEMYSEKLIVTMTKDPTLKARVIRIWMADPYKQFHKTDAIGRETVQSMLNRTVNERNLTNSILIGSNASVNAGSNITHMGNIIITEGQVRLNNPGGPNNRGNNGNAAIYYGITSSGYLKVYGPAKNGNEETTLFSQIINDGVRNTIGITYENLTVVNNKIVNSNLWGNEHALRNTLCQVNKNNFIMIVSSNGDRMREVANLQQAYGCNLGVNLDGGSSMNLFYKNRGASSITTVHSNVRTRPDSIYFSEF